MIPRLSSNTDKGSHGLKKRIIPWAENSHHGYEHAKTMGFDRECIGRDTRRGSGRDSPREKRQDIPRLNPRGAMTMVKAVVLSGSDPRLQHFIILCEIKAHSCSRSSP